MAGVDVAQDVQLPFDAPRLAASRHHAAVAGCSIQLDVTDGEPAPDPALFDRLIAVDLEQHVGSIRTTSHCNSGRSAAMARMLPVVSTCTPPTSTNDPYGDSQRRAPERSSSKSDGISNVAWPLGLASTSLTYRPSQELNAKSTAGPVPRPSRSSAGVSSASHPPAMTSPPASARRSSPSRWCPSTDRARLSGCLLTSPGSSALAWRSPRIHFT